MNLYPALQAQMGSWKYYIVKMKMREVATEVRFASEVYDDRTLDDAIQRELREGRVRKEIASFLVRRKDRFFASIVVAAIGGNPRFYPVRITDDPQFQVFVDQGIDQSFGVLTFSGEQRYYALDGQHRLKAIKTLLDRSDPISADTPEGFENEEISVLVVIKREETQEVFLKSYRRLFSSLNRYAKPTDADTNIIMDEDDAFAILTRRVISEHEFFKWTGSTDSARVKTKGKNLRPDEPHFTTLQTLYSMNQTLLSSSWRVNTGWQSGSDSPYPEKDISIFRRFRPREEYLDQLHEELTLYWNALIEVVPQLRNEPIKNRAHDADQRQDGLVDSALFWPIGQELLARISRRLLDKRQPEERIKVPTPDSARAALLPLKYLEWDLHRAPWRFLLLTKTDDGWKMRSEDRTQASDLAFLILRWIVGIDDLSTEDIAELKRKWQERLVLPAQTINAADQLDQLWGEMENLKSKIMSTP